MGLRRTARIRLLSFAFTLFSLSVSNAWSKTDPCECNEDAWAHLSCGPTPFGLATDTEINTGDRQVCSARTKNLTYLAEAAKYLPDFLVPKKLSDQSLNDYESNLKKKESARFADLGMPFESKTNAELLDYFYCYAGKENFCHYRKTLSRYIEKAAAISGFPFATEACMFFKESNFKGTAKSSESAKGVAQFIGSARKTLNEVLTYSQEEYVKYINETKASIVQHQKDLEKFTRLKNKRQITFHNDQLNFLSAKKLRQESKLAARKVWDQYWGKSASDPKKTTWDLHVKNKKRPKGDQVTDSDLACSQIAVIAGEVKKVNDYYLLSDNDGASLSEDATGKNKSYNQINAGETSIFMSAIYNTGESNIPEDCFPAQSFQECYKLFKNKETLAHMEGIRNCAQRFSFEPANGKKQECAGKKCGT